MADQARRRRGVLLPSWLRPHQGDILYVLGAAGLAVGLALKDSLSNIASVFFFFVLRPFRDGDYVQAAGLEGITSISLNPDSVIATWQQLAG